MRELRKKYNLTQSAFSKLTGVPMRTLQGWELGERKCPGYVIDLLTFFLDAKLGSEELPK